MTTPGGGVIATVYVRVLPEVQRFAGELRRSLRQSSRELRRIDREIEPVNQALRRMAVLATAIVPGAKLARASLLAMGAHAVVGGILAVAAVTETLTGALLALPAVGVAAASGFAAISVGMFGVQDAFKQFFKNEEKFNDKVDKLSKNAQATAHVFSDLRGRIEDFRNSVQDRLFAGMDVVIRGLADTFLPRLQAHFGNIVDIVNGGAKDLAAFAQSATTLRDVDSVTGNIELGFTRLRGALIPAATAFRDIVTVGATFLPQLGTEIARVAERFATWISTMRATGQLHDFIQNGIDAFKQLFRIIGNIGSIIQSVLNAAHESGLGFLDVLEKLTGSLAKFLNSTRGQEMLTSFMESAKGAAQALAPVLVALADLLFNHILPVFEIIAKAVGPAVAEFFSALGDAITQAAPGIKVFALGFAEFIRALIPALPAIAQLVSTVAQLVGILSGRLGPIIASMASAIANVLTPIFSALSAIIMFLPAPVLQLVVAFGALVVIVASLITVIRGVQAIASLFAGGLELMAKGLLKTKGAAGTLVGFLTGPWGLGISVALIALSLFLSATEDNSQEMAHFRQVSASLNDTIREQNGVINENVRIKAAQALEDEHLLATAKALGLSTKDVTDAYLEQGDALKTLRDKLQKIIDEGEGGLFSADDPKAVLAQKLLDDINALVDAKHQDADATKREAEAASAGISPMSAWGAVIAGTKDAINGLTEAQVRSQQVQLNALNSQIAYQNQLSRTTEELAEGNRTLDINTQEGRDNLSSITALAQAGIQRVNDLKAQGKGTTEVTQATIDMSEQLINMITPFFQTRDAARLYLEQLGLIPRRIDTQVFLNISQVLDAARQATNAILSIPKMLFPGFGGHAAGGPVKPGEWTWVGEKGPELVRFGQSARVYSNSDSERMSRDVSDLDTMTQRSTNNTQSRYATPTPAPAATTTVMEPQFDVRVYLGTQELTDMVRVEVAQHDAQLVRLISAGAGKRR